MGYGMLDQMGMRDSMQAAYDEMRTAFESTYASFPFHLLVALHLYTQTTRT